MMMMVMNCFYGLVDRRRYGLALFPAGTIVRDPHHRESPTRRESLSFFTRHGSIMLNLIHRHIFRTLSNTYDGWSFFAKIVYGAS